MYVISDTCILTTEELSIATYRKVLKKECKIFKEDTVPTKIIQKNPHSFLNSQIFLSYLELCIKPPSKEYFATEVFKSLGIVQKL